MVVSLSPDVDPFILNSINHLFLSLSTISAFLLSPLFLDHMHLFRMKSITSVCDPVSTRFPALSISFVSFFFFTCFDTLQFPSCHSNLQNGRLWHCCIFLFFCRPHRVWFSLNGGTFFAALYLHSFSVGLFGIG